VSEEEKALDALKASSSAGSVAVMCCGCISVMQKDGSARKWRIGEEQPEAAVFANAFDADSSALVMGWSVTEGNHRCRECSKKARLGVERKGAIVSAELVG